MRAKAFPGEDPQTLPEAGALAPLILELAAPDCTTHGQIIDYPDWVKG